MDFLYKPLDMRVVKSKVRIFKELQEQKLLVMEQFGRLAEAMRWKDDFLSIASHELKTPITSIRLNLQIAEKQFSDDVAQPLPPDKMKRIFSATYSQFNKLTRLIDDLLDTTRIRAGKLTVELELADLSKLVKDVVERFLPELQNVRCPLRLAIEEGIVVRCDPFRTEQVLANLLSNVVKYAPGRPVTLSLSGTDAGARLSVKDQGPGIPANEVNSVFERFERGQNSGKGISGLGLGLYIVKQIIEAHSGSITLETTEGSGSEFIVIFPCIHIM